MKEIRKDLYERLYALTKTDSLKTFRAKLNDLYAENVLWRGTYPFSEYQGTEEIVNHVWAPLMEAFPDLERRDSIFMGGEYNGQLYIVCVGHYTGTYAKPWLSLPAATNANNNAKRIIQLRYGEVYHIDPNAADGRVITQVTAFWDILDFIHQAGFRPFAQSMGDEIVWSGPITGDGIVLEEQDRALSAANIAQTRAMHNSLQDFDDNKMLSRENLLSMPQQQYWHPAMMWYGPAGIGSTRGLNGFVDWHQLPFRRAFPNRQAHEQDLYLGDGAYSCSLGWPGIRATHSAGDFLSLPPTGKTVTMRVMDIYLHHEGLIRENWVLLDILDILDQLGVDVFKRIKHNHPDQ